jgi:(methylthio)acryloyl-CoA hydratase
MSQVIPALSEISLTLQGDIAIVRLMRNAKRNALSDGLMAALEHTFEHLPSHIKAAVIDGEGEHFCAGLDLSELKERDAVQGVHHSRSWHRILTNIEFGRIPVVAALHGAVVGGGLELATSCHIRVMDETAFFALPEGSRGIFVGGGGSVRVPKLIGAHRMLDMMLTGRVYKGEACTQLGFAQYFEPSGNTGEGAGRNDGHGALNKAIAIAERMAKNAPMTNYALMHGLPRIAEQPADHGFFTESLLASIAQSAPEAKERVRAFLERGADKVRA